MEGPYLYKQVSEDNPVHVYQFCLNPLNCPHYTTIERGNAYAKVDVG